MPPGERPSREVLHAHAIRQVQVSLLHVIGQCHLVRLRRRGKLGIVGQPEFGARTRVIQGIMPTRVKGVRGRAAAGSAS